MVLSFFIGLIAIGAIITTGANVAIACELRKIRKLQQHQLILAQKNALPTIIRLPSYKEQ